MSFLIWLYRNTNAVALSKKSYKSHCLSGEGFSGSLWWKNFYNLATEVGFSPPRLVNARPIEVDREDFKQVIGEFGTNHVLPRGEGGSSCYQTGRSVNTSPGPYPFSDAIGASCKTK